MNQFVSIIVPLGVKCFHKVGFVTYQSHHVDVWCNVHLHADAWRDKQAEALLFFFLPQSYEKQSERYSSLPHLLYIFRPKAQPTLAIFFNEMLNICLRSKIFTE